MSNFSGSYSSGIVLNAPSTQNPSTVTASGYVTNTTTAQGGDAVYGTDIASWTLGNYGTITATAGNAVHLRGSGDMTNGSTADTAALISGASAGVRIDGTTSAVSNFGLIQGTAAGINFYHLGAGSGAVINSGTIAGVGSGATGVSVSLTDGTLINSASGLIVGGTYGAAFLFGESTGTVVNAGTIIAKTFGLRFAGTGSVDNAGLIAGGTVDYSEGILLGAGIITNTGTISGTRDAVLGSAVTIFNSGTILGTKHGTGVQLNQYNANFANLITNSTNGVISGYAAGAYVRSGTVVNLGTIAGAAGSGASLYAGRLVNSTGALISGGFEGVSTGSLKSTIFNYGTIEATGASTLTIGVALGGLLYNSALVTSTAVGVNGGSINNHGTIAGGVNGVVGGGTNPIVNYGLIEGTGTGTGILTVGGTISNTATGVITGFSAGIRSTIAPATIVNQGTVSGTGTMAAGISLYDGFLTNSGAGLIAGSYQGVLFGLAGGTIINAGRVVVIGTNGTGVRLLGGGTIFSSGTISSPAVGVYMKTAATLTNSGTISGLNDGVVSGSPTNRIANFGYILSTQGTGIEAQSGGVIANGSLGATTATIKGVNAGVEVDHAAGTVTNYGTIESTGSNSIAAFLPAGGSVINNGTILSSPGTPGDGIIIGALGTSDNVIGIGTIVNSGLISGTRMGIWLKAGGTVINSGTIVGNNGTDAYPFGIFLGTSLGGPTGEVVNSGAINNSGTIIGSIGVSISRHEPGHNTIVNSGTIIGTNGTAISFGGSYSNLLILENGYKLIGAVQGSTTAGAHNTLELLGAVGNGVTAHYNSLGLSHFQNVLFGSGYATLGVAAMSGTPGIVVSGFTATSDMIDLSAIGTNGTISAQTSTLVTVSGSSGAVTLQLDASDATVFTTTSDGASGTNLVPLCFCRGTHILTASGEVCIEELQVGDRVRTFTGRLKSIIWIGMGRAWW